jgi:hypothetical protein
MRQYQLTYNEEDLTLYHNSEEWVLHDGKKVITWSGNSGELFELYGKEAAIELYRDIVNVTEMGKGAILELEQIPKDVLLLSEKFSE